MQINVSFKRLLNYFLFMILPEKQIKQLRKALEEASRPLFIYDDDPDGLCSFLLLYRFVKDGRGVIVKTTSYLGKEWARYVHEYNPDAVFVLDVPVVEQEFIDEVDVNIHWIDHHMPVERKKVNYYNPRLTDLKAYIPTTRMCYEVVKYKSREDSWIAAVGCVADWYLPDFENELVDKKIKDAETALYESDAGKLARVFSFLLKGKTSDVHRCIKVLSRIKDPNEILNSSSAEGKFIFKRFEKINKKYEKLLSYALKKVHKEKFFVFLYDEDQWSFTSELSGELSHRCPNKVIVVCREKKGEYKCSFRSREKPILYAVQKALDGVSGKGGGHENACGAVIASEDFERFVERLKESY